MKDNVSIILIKRRKDKEMESRIKLKVVNLLSTDIFDIISFIFLKK